MPLRLPRPTTTESRRSIWVALGFNADDNPEVVANRSDWLAEVAAIWPFVLFAQLLAPLGVALGADHSGQHTILTETTTRGLLVLAMTLGALAQLRLPKAREWPVHVQIRTLTLCAAGIGAGLLSLLPLLVATTFSQYQLAGFVAVFAAATITAVAIHPVRAATLGYATALAIAVAADSGLLLPSLEAAIALVAVIVATVRLARDDPANA